MDELAVSFKQFERESYLCLNLFRNRVQKSASVSLSHFNAIPFCEWMYKYLGSTTRDMLSYVVLCNGCLLKVLMWTRLELT